MAARPLTLGFPLRLSIFGLAVLATPALRAEVKVNGLFADHMVLQRDAKVPVWGTAEPGEAVSVAIDGREASARADASGRWRATLGPLKAGGPHDLTITGKTTLTIRDVLVGEVWVCSGQSNMAYPLGSLKTTAFAKDVDAGDDPFLRQGRVPNRASIEPVDDLAVKWVAYGPETASGFTAVGYFFARELRRELNVPVGLIFSARGGTSAESWTSRDALASVPDFRDRAESQVANLRTLPGRIRTFPASIDAWERSNGRGDLGLDDDHRRWADLDVDPSSWTPTRLNTPWKDAGLPDGGIVWLRYSLEVPPEAAGKDFRFDLGFVDEQSEATFFNGVKLGESGRKPPEYLSRYVGYAVPGRLVKAGKNVVAIRFKANTGDKPGLARRADTLGFRSLGLRRLPDDAAMRVEVAFPLLNDQARADRPLSPRGDSVHTSGNLFNAMIHPLIPASIRGVVWYQGEQDAGRAFAYRTLLPLMIRDWRARWGQGDFPFLIQQLPNWQAIQDQPEESDWAEMREAQAMTASDVPNCALSCAIEVGDPDDVHPANKPEVGRRLALVALAKAYERPIESSGPEYASMGVEGLAIRLRFRHAEGLRSSDGGPLRRFAVAGADRRFAWAEAKVEGDSVVVSSRDVPKPEAVRYAWASSPEGCNLTNATGLPAFPFRTDQWPGRTELRK